MASTITEPKDKSGPWIPLESNPEVFTSWAKKLGMADTGRFEDVYGLDPELLQMVEGPVKAVLLIFPISPESEKRRKEEDAAMRKDGLSPHVDQTVIFIEQKISNACGTIGLLHALMNSGVTISPGSPLEKFLHQCMPLPPSDRADLLAKTNLFARAHAEAATSNDSSSSVPRDLNTNLHFTCFIQATSPQEDGEMRLIELDGRRAGPIDHGKSTKLLDDVAVTVKKNYLTLTTSLEFGLVALSGS